MKKVISKNLNDFYKLFKPQLTPKKMLELGVFGGSYFGLNIKKYPKPWFKKAKISKNFDVNINRFKVKSGLSRKEWQKKGGFSSKIHLVGFNGTVGFQMEDAFLI
jgi:hypothetical protein